MHLLFDLDNTLYPANSNMNAGITSRMIEFVANFIDVSVPKAAELRTNDMPKYGTTLEWLQKEYELKDIDSFMNAVHPKTETDELDFDPNLRPLLQSIIKKYNCKMSILTNSPAIHANRVLDFFNITDLFCKIHNIETNNFNGKPHKSAYLSATEESGISLNDTLFFDDLEKYTTGFTKLGGKSVWVTKKLAFPGESGTNDNPSNIEHNTELLPYACIKSIYDLPALLEHILNY